MENNYLQECIKYLKEQKQSLLILQIKITPEEEVYEIDFGEGERKLKKKEIIKLAHITKLNELLTNCGELYGCTYEITYDEEGKKKYKMNGLDEDEYMYYFTDEIACNGYGKYDYVIEACCHKRYRSGMEKKTFEKIQEKNKLFNINTIDIWDIVDIDRRVN
jgi:hypothetical protein